MDTADTFSSFNGGDHDVTLVSPASTPGVSDDVVVYSIFVSISDGGDGVIEVGSTGSGVKDTSGVTLEGRCVSFNGDGDWSGGNSRDKLGSRVSLNGVNV